MVCGRADLRGREELPDPEGFTLAEPRTDEQFRAIAQVQDDACGGTGSVVPDRVRSLRSGVRAGGVVVGAWPDQGALPWPVGSAPRFGTASSRSQGSPWRPIGAVADWPSP